MYQQVPPVCDMLNIDGEVGGISPYFRSALFYVDSNPPLASRFKDYAGQFGKSGIHAAALVDFSFAVTERDC